MAFARRRVAPGNIGAPRNHRKYLPPQFFTQRVPVSSAIDACHHFDRHEQGWLKVKLEPAAVPHAA